MKQLKKRYILATIAGIIASLVILVFLAIGTIGGDNSVGIPWASYVNGSSTRFGLLNISYRFMLNIFFCFGRSGWTWDFARITIAAGFWASLLLLIIAIVTSAKREKRLILPSIFIFLNVCGALWVIEGITYARYLNIMRLRYVGSFAFCIAGGICAVVLLLIAISTSHQIRVLENQGCDLVTKLEQRVNELEEKLAEHEAKETVVIKEVVKEEAPAAVVEEKPVEVKVEETVVEEAPAEVKTGNLNIQRIPFAVKYKEADEDLRQKFDELSSYITETYGIKGRESIAGMSFSAHREKLVFATIIGKHIRCNFALDANNYNDSTMPVTNSDNKKYADVPLTLKVKSGLSLRRAKALVDDVMAAKNIEKIVK